MTQFEADPDNPDPREIEEQAREEARRQEGDVPEELLDQEEMGETREHLNEPLGQDFVSKEADRLSPEYGKIRANIEDNVEEEATDIMGYHAGSETPDMAGEIVHDEANPGLVAVEYVLSENLVDTIGRVQVPVIDTYVSPQDNDLLSMAYERDNLEIDVRRDKEGNYNAKVVHETPENLEEGIGEVARFLAEFENELTNAYESPHEGETGQWNTGGVTQALEGESHVDSNLQTERRIRGD